MSVKRVRQKRQCIPHAPADRRVRCAQPITRHRSLQPPPGPPVARVVGGGRWTAVAALTVDQFDPGHLLLYSRQLTGQKSTVTIYTYHSKTISAKLSRDSFAPITESLPTAVGAHSVIEKPRGSTLSRYTPLARMMRTLRRDHAPLLPWLCRRGAPGVPSHRCGTFPSRINLPTPGPLTPRCVSHLTVGGPPGSHGGRAATLAQFRTRSLANGQVHDGRPVTSERPVVQHLGE